MKHLLPLAVLAVALVAADKPADEKKTDKDRIQGTWVVTVVENDGQTLKDGDLFDHVKDIKLTFKGDKVKNSKKPDEDGSFKIDPDKKPPTLELSVIGEKATETIALLYELKGDTLTVCMSLANKEEYPKELTSKNGQLLLTLKREVK